MSVWMALKNPVIKNTQTQISLLLHCDSVGNIKSIGGFLSAVDDAAVSMERVRLGNSKAHMGAAVLVRDRATCEIVDSEFVDSRNALFATVALFGSRVRARVVRSRFDGCRSQAIASSFYVNDGAQLGLDDSIITNGQVNLWRCWRFTTS